MPGNNNTSLYVIHAMCFYLCNKNYLNSIEYNSLLVITWNIKIRHCREHKSSRTKFACVVLREKETVFNLRAAVPKFALDRLHACPRRHMVISVSHQEKLASYESKGGAISHLH